MPRHGAAIRPEDDEKRLDRLLWDGKTEAARRMLARVPPDYRALAEARLALALQAPAADLLVARVPAQLRADPGLLYEELRWRREKEMTDAAVDILRANPGDPVQPDAWWHEREIIARRLLAGGNADLAYQIAAQHGVLDGKAYADAEFLLGYIALRFKKDPALAFDDFAHILTRADSPYAKARAGYWGGRAAEAEAKPALARKWYAAGRRAHGDVLRPARGAPARRRRAAASGAGAGARPPPSARPSTATRWCVRPRCFLRSATANAARSS